MDFQTSTLLSCIILFLTVVALLGNDRSFLWTNIQPGNYVVLSDFQGQITVDGLMSNLAELQSIADANGGNRAFGYSGYDASVDFVRSKLEKFSATSIIRTQNFTTLFNKVESISLEANGVGYFVHGLSFSPSTVREGIRAKLVLGPTGDKGCTAEGYDGFDVRNQIVLVERGACPTGGTLAGRVRPAAARGAAAVVIYNNVPDHITYGTLTAPDAENLVPAGFIDQVDGWSLRDMLLAQEVVEVYFQQTQLIYNKTSQNLFAETVGGDENNVIMLGAHLDSVLAGPGINDNGSGTSLLLELFTALQPYTSSVKHKIRFAFWGAEESSMAGSQSYLSTLTPTSLSQILLYLNFDMVGRGYFGVFDGDGSSFGAESAGATGSEVAEKLFVDELVRKGVEVTPVKLTGGSDYKWFMEAGIPVGGLHSGTGKEQDSCYHLACDTYNNVNSTVLSINAKAAGHVLGALAMSDGTLLFKTEMMAMERRRFGEWPANRTQPEPRSFAWNNSSDSEHSGNCGHID